MQRNVSRHAQMLELSGRLESAEAEWRSLLCGSQKLTEEKEELLRSVTSLKEDNQRLGAQVTADFEHAEPWRGKLLWFSRTDRLCVHADEGSAARTDPTGAAGDAADLRARGGQPAAPRGGSKPLRGSEKGLDSKPELHLLLLK